MAMSHGLDPYAEHPEDVLRQWFEWRKLGPVALVAVTKTAGGGVRAPGALMAVREHGARCGYISGGCIDHDVALRAVECLKSGKGMTLRYGVGSPILDLRLPCGGTIEVQIFPDAPREAVQRCQIDLESRRPAALSFPALERSFSYLPKLRVRIAGGGADALALARLVAASGFELILQLRTSEDLEVAKRSGLPAAVALGSPAEPPAIEDDAWTAFVLMLHDPDWEAALLKQALAGKAFYIGAVGSQRALARRTASLLAAGVGEPEIGRIRGPIGLIAAMRSASMLAVSVLAEIIEEFHRARVRPFAKTALILLAAGASLRFAAGDKLLADLNGQPVLAHSANILGGHEIAARIAIVGPDQHARAALAAAAGWSVLTNPEAAQGQATSLRVGIGAAAKQAQIERVLVLLADMPLVSDAHMLALQEAAISDAPAVMSLADGALCPPAIISRDLFPALMGLTGDQGARAVLADLPGVRSVAIARDEAIDIDTRDDLARASAH